MLVIIAALFFTLFYPPLLLSLDIPKISLPKLRNFIYFNTRVTEIQEETFSKFQSLVHGEFRIIQFNMLADGLSGLRTDLGAFSRAKEEDVCWESRKVKILYELLQYDPDVITLQECDHYYDFFLPALSAKGYDGIFAPKPASACLEVSENSDGCAIFVRRSKFLIRSSETITYALSKAEVSAESEMKDEDRQVRPQNQVALIAVCDILPATKAGVKSFQTNTLYAPPPIILVTTHLKATKSEVGERFRLKEMQLLLAAVERCRSSIASRFSGRAPAVVIAGDLNACPTALSSSSVNGVKYPSTVYPMIKKHPMGFRSVLNDDLLEYLAQQSFSPGKNEDVEARIWTTWKARRKRGEEFVSKHCIDYVIYVTPPQSGTGAGIRALSTASLFEDAAVAAELFPSASYPSDHVSVVADLQIEETVPIDE